MTNGYEKNMQIIWDAKETLYQEFLKSGMKNYLDFIRKEVEDMKKNGVIDDTIYKKESLKNPSK